MVVGGFAPEVNIFYAVIGLAQSLNDTASTRTESNAGLEITIAQLFSDITQDFLEIRYGIDALRRRIRQNSMSVDAWFQQEIKMPSDTEELDKSINRRFRRYVWERLLPVGCRIKRLKAANWHRELGMAGDRLPTNYPANLKPEWDKKEKRTKKYLRLAPG